MQQEQEQQEQESMATEGIRLTILQQPVRGRASGISEVLGKRLLDPPLVIKLTLPPTMTTKLQPQPRLGECLDGYSCIASICDPDSTNPISMVKRIQRHFISNLLVGSLTQCPCYYSIIEGVKGPLEPLLIFTNLAIRLPGIYRIHLICVSHQRNGVVASVTTNNINILVPADYPGLDGSNPLTRSLFLQSAGVRVNRYKSAPSPTTTATTAARNEQHQLGGDVEEVEEEVEEDASPTVAHDHEKDTLYVQDADTAEDEEEEYEEPGKVLP